MRVVDLVQQLPHADKRPAQARFEVAEHTLSSVHHATIVAPAPSRLIWKVRLPARGVVGAWLAVVPIGESPEASVTFRLGISDGRLYDPLDQQLVTASLSQAKGWIPFFTDVSLYGGRQWSLFYRPGKTEWSLIFNADVGSGTARALWGAPGIDTDPNGARDWRKKEVR